MAELKRAVQRSRIKKELRLREQADIENLVEDKYAYFDVVSISFEKYAINIDLLKRFLTEEKRAGNIKDFVVLVKRETWNSLRKVVGFTFKILQPKQAWLEKLERFLYSINGFEYSISYLEVAYDYIVANSKIGEWLKEILAKYIVLKNTRSEPEIRGRTYYLAQINKGRNIVLYGDRKSKILKGKPRCHLELRFKGKRNIRSIGVYDFPSLASLNLRKLLEENLHLYTVTSKAIVGKEHRLYVAKRKNKITDHGYRKHFHSVYEGEVFLAQVLWSNRYINNKVLDRVDTSLFLPEWVY